MLGSANNMKEIDPMGLVCHYTAYAITQRLSPTVAVPMCLGVVSCCQMESKKEARHGPSRLPVSRNTALYLRLIDELPAWYAAAQVHCRKHVASTRCSSWNYPFRSVGRPAALAGRSDGGPETDGRGRWREGWAIRETGLGRCEER